MQLSKESIGIFGLGMTGISVYEDLIRNSKTVICYDDSKANRDNFIARFGKGSIIPVENEIWKQLDRIVVSPGIPHSHHIFELARAHDILITSDIELFIERNKSSEFIFITGTNGKSTTTALVGHILAQAQEDYQIGGNIGKAVMSLPIGCKGYIFELSSFQIELLYKKEWIPAGVGMTRGVVNPKIAVITNITPDHLDRYASVEEYTQVKERILVPAAFKIIGINSEISRKAYEKFSRLDKSNVIPVSIKPSWRGDKSPTGVYLRGAEGNEAIPGGYDEHSSSSSEIATHSSNARNDDASLFPCNDGIFCDDNHLHDNYFDHQEYPLFPLPHLRGAHNKENIGISYAICRALGVSAESIIEALKSFKGLEHRMQYAGKYKNIEFYNDSKATNISSALSSLSVFNNIVWFAGGRFKEDSLVELEPIIKNIKKAYLFGESKDLFAEYLESKVDYEICNDLSEAFAKAMKYSAKITEDLTFLLAPACASYDQFKNFEERGGLFCELVLAINEVQNEKFS